MLFGKCGTSIFKKMDKPLKTDIIGYGSLEKKKILKCFTVHQLNGISIQFCLHLLNKLQGYKKSIFTV